jgi:hypothetical protein
MFRKVMTVCYENHVKLKYTVWAECRVCVILKELVLIVTDCFKRLKAYNNYVAKGFTWHGQEIPDTEHEGL